ncbi:MAG TPA: O-antigen ligase family protein [Candidatus Limnocylindria bacterium]|nr:O-antigen ligase family protein [Candidatus Limnocylindria bacterium]
MTAAMRRAAPPVTGLTYSAAAVATLLAGLALARVSTPAFLGFGAAFVLLLGYGAHRWPRAILLVIALTPLVDAYLVRPLLPVELHLWSRVLSEALLGVAVLVVGFTAWRNGTLVPALRHRITPILIVFLAVAAISTLVNAVPLHVAALGVTLTVDAVALFYLARAVPFSDRFAALCVGAFVAAMLGAGVVAILQIVLGPPVVGLPFRVGALGESVRVGSVFVDQGVLGGAAGVAAAFPLFAVFRLPNRPDRYVAMAVALVLLIAVVLTFSRGSWVGVAAGIGVVALLLDRRAFLLMLVLGLLAVGAVQFMPRNLLLPSATDPASGGPAAPGAAAGGQQAPTPAISRSPSATPPPEPDIAESTVGKVVRVFTGGDARARFVFNAVPIVADHPVVGVGPGRYGGAAADIFGTPIHARYETDEILDRVRARTVDNFWLHTLVEFGIVGFVAYVALFAVLAVSLFRAARHADGARFVFFAGTLASLAFLVVHSLTGMLLEGNAVSFALWLFLGIGSTLEVPARSETV